MIFHQKTQYAEAPINQSNITRHYEKFNISRKSMTNGLQQSSFKGCGIQGGSKIALSGRLLYAFSLNPTNRCHQWGFGCQDRSSCCLQIFGLQYRNNYYLGQFDLQGKCTHYLPVSDFQDKHIFLGPKFDCLGRHKYCQSIFDHQDSLQDAKLRIIELGKKLKWK